MKAERIDDSSEIDEESIQKKIDHELDAKVDVATIRHDEGINLKESSEERLVFRKFPLAAWISGGVVSIVGLYLIFHLSFGHFGKVLTKGSVQ